MSRAEIPFLSFHVTNRHEVTKSARKARKKMSKIANSIYKHGLPKTIRKFNTGGCVATDYITNYAVFIFSDYKVIVSKDILQLRSKYVWKKEVEVDENPLNLGMSLEEYQLNTQLRGTMDNADAVVSAHAHKLLDPTTGTSSSRKVVKLTTDMISCK